MVVGRNRSFDEAEVVAAASRAFVVTGYEGTSVDDLVAATGLFRGSLYKAFGSKRGLFLAGLDALASRGELAGEELDLLLVALLDVAPTDERVRATCAGLVERLADPEGAPAVLGARLLARAGLPTTPGAATTSSTTKNRNTSTTPTTTGPAVDGASRRSS